MLGKSFERRWPSEDRFFVRLIVVLVLLSLSGCAAVGGYFTFFVGRDEKDEPPNTDSMGGSQKLIYLGPAFFGRDCNAVCVQKANDGIGCTRYSEEATADCSKFVGEKK